MNPKIGGSSPSQVEIFSVSKLWHFHKNTRSCVENECCCPRTVNISNVNFTSKIIKLHVRPEIVNADPFIGAHDQLMASMYWLRSLYNNIYTLSYDTFVSLFMMTSSNGNVLALLALCAGNSPVIGEFPTQRPVTRSFDVFFDLRLNKRLGQQSRRWWFETPSCLLWGHCNV